MHKAKLALFMYTKNAAGQVQTLYRGSDGDRAQLLIFMDANAWFGSIEEWVGEEVYIFKSDEFEKALPRWLKGCGLETSGKLAILLDDFDLSFPLTVKGCRTCLDREHGWNSRAFLMAVDHVLYAADQSKKELTDFSDADLHMVMVSASARLGPGAFDSLKALVRVICPEFLNVMDYSLIQAHCDPESICAYTLADFSSLAWFALNPESWEKNDLLRKAADNPAYGRRWLFMAMTFVCALRGTDLVRLPAPDLDGPAPEAARKILSDPDRDSLASALVDDWIRKIRSLHMTPNKTASTSNVPELLVNIPDILKISMGIILASSLLHMDRPDAPLMIRGFPVFYLRNFFGEEIVDLLDGREFSIRRANKSFLQGIAAAGGVKEGSMEGYILASLARSHKGGFRTLAGTTDIYLRDASFAGQSPDYVIRQMFERGPFGWVLSSVLDSCDRKAFRSITVKGQTEAILSIGLDPLQVEQLAGCCTLVCSDARQVVLSLLGDLAGLPERMEKALHKLASSREEEESCLIRAAGSTCPFKGRASCMGCRYEACSLALLQALLKEAVSLVEKIESLRQPSDKEEKDRLTNVLRKAVFPVIRQFIETWESLYPDADAHILKQIRFKGKKLMESIRGGN